MSTPSATALGLGRWQLARNHVSFGGQRGVIKLGLCTNDHSTLPRKVEVGRRRTQEDFAEEDAGRIPHVNAIAYAGVDITIGVAMDAVWNSRRSVSEDLAVAECAIRFDREAITTQKLSKCLQVSQKGFLH